MGDSSVLLGVVVTSAIYFFICRDNRQAFAILASLALATGLIGILELIFTGCGHSLFDIRSLSGHAALSVAVYGTYPLLLEGRVGHKTKIGLFCFFYALALAIVITRVSLNLHSVSEAVLGILVGLSIIGFIKYIELRHKWFGLNFTPRFNSFVLLALTAGVIFYLHGLHFPGEHMINKTANHLKSTISICR